MTFGLPGAFSHENGTLSLVFWIAHTEYDEQDESPTTEQPRRLVDKRGAFKSNFLGRFLSIFSIQRVQELDGVFEIIV